MPRDWDRCYADARHLDDTPSALLVDAADRLPPGSALDIACGQGRNSIYLAKLGWQVTAVDRSAVAIDLLRRRSAGLPVDSLAADLERGEYRIAPGSFDLICDILYLQRDLFPPMREGVRPGGLFLGEMLLHDPAVKEGESPFRLHPGELRAEFEGWKILYYSEGAEPGKAHRTARIAARRA